MASGRTYGDACAAAHALDLVGDRWALLVVRELLFGPKRFTDLRSGLPQVAANRLTQRLRELEGVGVLRRRWLESPARVWVYELTEWGEELEPVLTLLGRWGRRSPFRDLEAPISADALMLALRGDFDVRAFPGPAATYVIGFGEASFTATVGENRLEVVRGRTSSADVVIDTDTRTFASVVTGKQPWQDAREAGSLRIEGDVHALERFITAWPRPR